MVPLASWPDPLNMMYVFWQGGHLGSMCGIVNESDGILDLSLEEVLLLKLLSTGWFVVLLIKVMI